MKEQNPIGNLYDDILTIIKSLVIKYRSKAIVDDTYDVRRAADAYIDAYEKKDSFLTYRVYDVEDYVAVGIRDYLDIKQAMDYPRTVPADKQQQLLEIRRQRIIDNYVEKNNYYRKLHGLPDLDDTEFFYVSEEISERYGIPMDIPIHDIEDKLGVGTISILEGLGYIDELFAAHPEKGYLNFIGSKRIDIITARRASNFSILYMSKSAQEPVTNKFIVLYEKARDYFTSVVYNPSLSSGTPYYDNFIALCISVMTIQQLVSRSLENVIDRDFFDLNSVKALYDSYNFPFMSRLDWERQKAIVQNLNILIQNKATNKVLYDIAALLGFQDINIYKYFLTKQTSYDVYGNPIIATKQEVNVDTGELETVYDYEKMYEVYFQKVELNHLDFMEAFQDEALIEDYDERTIPDPFWWEDSGLYHEVWEEEYNYAETKYLGISISYRLSNMIFETILLLRMIIDKRYELNDMMLELPRIGNGLSATLFDSVITLICLICKKHNLGGEIISDYPNTVAVLDTMDIIANESEGTYIDCLNFDFPALSADRIEDTCKEILECLDEDETITFNELISILSVLGSSDLSEKTKAFNQMYENIRNLSVFLEWKMSETDDIEEYQVLMRFYRAVFYTNEMRDTFRMGTGKGQPIAKTFFEYLDYLNPVLSDFVNTCEEDYIGVYMDHIISKMEQYINDLNYLYTFSDMDSPAEEALVTMINFFKSFTTDFTGLDTLYTLDLKGLHMLRLIDKVHHIYKICQIDENDTGFRLQDFIHHIYTSTTLRERIDFIDKLWSTVRSSINDKDNNTIELYEEFKQLTKIAIISADKEGSILQDHIHSIITDRRNEYMTLTDSVKSMKVLTDQIDGLGYIVNAFADYIGKHVKIYESGSSGSTTVGHSGVDGGGSYGTYQMIWSYNGYPGMAQTFWARYYASRYGSVSTVAELNRLWVKAATDDPDQFFRNEHHYVAELCYEPMVELLGNDFNPNLHSRACQECFWSWSVHRGYQTAAKEFLEIGLTADQFKRISIDDLMNLCYDKRRAVMLEIGGDYNTAIANGRYGYGTTISCERYQMIHGLPDISPFRNIVS